VKQGSVLPISEHIAINGDPVHGAFGHEVRGNVDGTHELEKLAPRPGSRPRRKHNVTRDLVAGGEHLVAWETEAGRESNGLAGAVPKERQQPFFRSDTYSLPYQLVLISPTYNHGISACSTTAIAVSSLTCPKSTPTKY
jgi:hypothetical protein